MSAFVSRSGAGRRPVITTFPPRRAASMARLRPIPVPPPVITTTFPSSVGTAGRAYERIAMAIRSAASSRYGDGVSAEVTSSRRRWSARSASPSSSTARPAAIRPAAIPPSTPERISATNSL